MTATAINVGAISTLTGSIASDFNGLAPGRQGLLRHGQRPGGHQRAQAGPGLQPGRRRAAQPVHPADPHPHRPGPRLRGDGGLVLVHPELLRRDPHPDLRLQRERQLGQGPATSSPPAELGAELRGRRARLRLLAKKTHSKTVAVISYGPAITSSYNACNATATVLKQAGYNVSYEDLGAQLGGSYSSAVQRMQQAGTDFVICCMQEIGQHHHGPGHPAVRAQDHTSCGSAATTSRSSTSTAA